MGRSQDRLPALAAELVALGPDLLVAGNPQSAIALKSATSIPLVFVGVGDPVGIGLVQSLSRPVRQHNGSCDLCAGTVRQQNVEALREMVPAASKIAILINPGNPIHRLGVAEEFPRRPATWAWLYHGGRTGHRLCLGRGPARRCKFSRWRSFDHSQRHTNYCAGGELSSARDLSRPTIRHRWRIDFIQPRFSRFVVACRRLRRQDPKRCQACGFASGATNQIRAGDQSQGREGSRPHSTAHATWSRRRGDRIGAYLFMARNGLGWAA